MSLLKTQFTKDAKIEYPIICGAMYPCTNPELVAAVSEAGGIGIVQPMSFVYLQHLDFRQALKNIRKRTSKPFGLNLILVPGYEKRLLEWTDIALEEGCRFFVTAMGKPTWVADKVHKHGGVVYHDAINLDHAKKALDVGVDGFICLNNRGGGHLGYQSTKDLYNELKPLGKPLICAGGIGDEKAFKDALDMGYDGVQMGTRFIATYECSEIKDYKNAILSADEKDIVITNKMDGHPSSVINTPYAQARGLKIDKLTSWLMRQRLTKNIVRGWINYRNFQNAQKGDTQRYYQAGKSAAAIHEIEPVKDIINRFVKAIK